MRHDLSVWISNPQVNGLLFKEDWTGKYIGSFKEGGTLRMASEVVGSPGSISAIIDNNLRLSKLIFNREDGNLILIKSDENYQLETKNFNDKVDIFGKQLSMHIAASNPIAINGELIPTEIINKEQ